MLYLHLFGWKSKGGGLAGLVVDTVLFPLDTLKTRLQAAQGFRKAGGLKGVYKGIGPQAIGSAPQGTNRCKLHWTKYFSSLTPSWILQNNVSRILISVLQKSLWIVHKLSKKNDVIFNIQILHKEHQELLKKNFSVDNSVS